MQRPETPEAIAYLCLAIIVLQTLPIFEPDSYPGEVSIESEIGSR